MADYIVAILLGVVLAKSNQMSQKNLKYNTNTKGMDSDMKKRCLLSLPDEMFIKK